MKARFCVKAVLSHRKSKAVRGVSHMMRLTASEAKAQASDKISAAYPSEDIQHIELKDAMTGSQVA